MPRRGRGNARAKLQKQLKVQRELENELQQLNSGKECKESAKEIIESVQKNGSDPMLSEENPFWEAGGSGCCQIL